MSKMFQSKRNGYVDLKGGGWGVEDNGETGTAARGQGFRLISRIWGWRGIAEEFVDQVVGESTDLRGHKKYVCSIQTQEHIEKLLAQRPV